MLLYILKYIQKNGLSDSVKFTGFLNEREIVGKFLKSHIFISASSIENSPNSVCEAMYLGVPVVSSMVGGVSNLMEDGKEGLNYQADAPYMMAYCIKKIFDNDTLASEFSINAIKRATERHEPVRIVNDLIGIYRKIAD